MPHVAHGIVHDMHDVSLPRRDATTGIPPVALDWDRVKAILGVRTNAEAADKMGMPLRTLSRLRACPARSPLRNLLLVREHTSLPLDEMLTFGDQATVTSRAA